jgi:outer membrane protein assembly factor BamB
MGGTGILNCLELASGKVIWSTNTLTEHGARIPDWGVGCSPLVTEGAVIVTVGGSGHALVAYDKVTGRKLWAAGSDDAHWSSPMRMSFLGMKPQIVIFNDTVAGHDEETGRVLWQHRWKGGHPHVTPPVAISPDTLLISSGYGTGSELLGLSFNGERWRATNVWKTIRLKSKFANIIRHGGFLYGLDDGALVCVELATQQLRWKGDRYGHGQMILVGELILLTAESGDIVLIEPSPDEQRELGRFKVFNAKTWNPPALAGDLLVVRNDREAACLRLPVAPRED